MSSTIIALPKGWVVEITTTGSGFTGEEDSAAEIGYTNKQWRQVVALRHESVTDETVPLIFIGSRLQRLDEHEKTLKGSMSVRGADFDGWDTYSMSNIEYDLEKFKELPRSTRETETSE